MLFPLGFPLERNLTFPWDYVFNSTVVNSPLFIRRQENNISLWLKLFCRFLTLSHFPGCGLLKIQEKLFHEKKTKTLSENTDHSYVCNPELSSEYACGGEPIEKTSNCTSSAWAAKSGEWAATKTRLSYLFYPAFTFLTTSYYIASTPPHCPTLLWLTFNNVLQKPYCPSIA